MSNGQDIGECVNLYIPLKDTGDFWKAITDAGYEKTGSGVVSYILETEPVEENWEQELPSAGSIAMGAVNDWARSHPQEWNRIKQKGSAVMRNLVDTIKKKL